MIEDGALHCKNHIKTVDLLVDETWNLEDVPEVPYGGHGV